MRVWRPYFPSASGQRFRGRGFCRNALFNWSERRDLNSGPPVPQTGALTGLRYAPCQAATIVLTARTRNDFEVSPAP
jgi:hypothetical protein